jgi:hypothetical protein
MASSAPKDAKRPSFDEDRVAGMQRIDEDDDHHVEHVGAEYIGYGHVVAMHAHASQNGASGKDVESPSSAAPKKLVPSPVCSASATRDQDRGSCQNGEDHQPVQCGLTSGVVGVFLRSVPRRLVGIHDRKSCDLEMTQIAAR